MDLVLEAKLTTEEAELQVKVMQVVMGIFMVRQWEVVVVAVLAALAVMLPWLVLVM
jgi:hypothetical protein